MDARALTLEISVLSLIARKLSLETSTVTRQLESSLWKLQRSLWCLYCFLSGLECSLSSLNAPMALETRHARGGIHHSDRRVQYASAAYVALLRQHQLQISMSLGGQVKSGHLWPPKTGHFRNGAGQGFLLLRDRVNQPNVSIVD